MSKMQKASLKQIPCLLKAEADLGCQLVQEYMQELHATPAGIFLCSKAYGLDTEGEAVTRAHATKRGTSETVPSNVPPPLVSGSVL